MHRAAETEGRSALPLLTPKYPPGDPAGPQPETEHRDGRRGLGFNRCGPVSRERETAPGGCIQVEN